MNGRFKAIKPVPTRFSAILAMSSARSAVLFAMLAIVQVSAPAPIPAQGVTVTATVLNEFSPPR
jgi:hypothetical protein